MPRRHKGAMIFLHYSYVLQTNIWDLKTTNQYTFIQLQYSNIYQIISVNDESLPRWSQDIIKSVLIIILRMVKQHGMLCNYFLRASTTHKSYARLLSISFIVPSIEEKRPDSISRSISTFTKMLIRWSLMPALIKVPVWIIKQKFNNSEVEQKRPINIP